MELRIKTYQHLEKHSMICQQIIQFRLNSNNLITSQQVKKVLSKSLKKLNQLRT